MSLITNAARKMRMTAQTIRLYSLHTQSLEVQALSLASTRNTRHKKPPAHRRSLAPLF